MLEPRISSESVPPQLVCRLCRGETEGLLAVKQKQAQYHTKTSTRCTILKQYFLHSELICFLVITLSTVIPVRCT